MRSASVSVSGGLRAAEIGSSWLYKDGDRIVVGGVNGEGLKVEGERDAKCHVSSVHHFTHIRDGSLSLRALMTDHCHAIDYLKWYSDSHFAGNCR